MRAFYLFFVTIIFCAFPIKTLCSEVIPLDEVEPGRTCSYFSQSNSVSCTNPLEIVPVVVEYPGQPKPPNTYTIGTIKADSRNMNYPEGKVRVYAPFPQPNDKTIFKLENGLFENETCVYNNQSKKAYCPRSEKPILNLIETSDFVRPANTYFLGTYTSPTTHQPLFIWAPQSSMPQPNNKATVYLINAKPVKDEICLYDSSLKKAYCTWSEKPISDIREKSFAEDTPAKPDFLLGEIPGIRPELLAGGYRSGYAWAPKPTIPQINNVNIFQLYPPTDRNESTINTNNCGVYDLNAKRVFCKDGNIIWNVIEMQSDSTQPQGYKLLGEYQRSLKTSGSQGAIKRIKFLVWAPV